MRLRNITTKAIPYIAVLTMAVGLMGCSGGDNADANKNTEITSTTGDVDITGEDNTTGKEDSADSTDNTASDNTVSDETASNITDNSGGDSNNNSSANNSSSGNGSDSGNSGSNNTSNTGNTGTSSNRPSGNTGGSGGGGSSSGNAGSSGFGSNTGSSGSGGGSSGGSNTGNGGSTGGSGNSGSSGNSNGSGGGVTFVEYVHETSYEYSSSKIDSYTTEYVTNEVDRAYELYSDGSKVLLPEYTSTKQKGSMTLTVKNTSDYTYVKLESTGTQYMNDEQKSLFNKYHDKSCGGDNYCTYYQRNSDGARFISEKALLGDTAAKALVKELGLDNTSVTKERRLFLLLKWMDDNVTYWPSDYNGSYACLINRKGICHDFTLTVCNVLSYTDIPVLYVSSINLNHAWNLVQLDDGCWYYIDATSEGTNAKTYGVQEIAGLSFMLENENEPYLKLGIETNEYAKDAIAYNYSKNYGNTGSKYKGVIKYPNKQNISLNYSYEDISTDNFPDGRIFIKGSKLTH